MPKKTSRKYLRKSIRRNRKLSKKTQSYKKKNYKKQIYKKKSHKRKNTFKRKMIKRNLKLGGTTDASRGKLAEIEDKSGEIKSNRRYLWTNLEGMLTNDGFTGIDDRGKLYETEGNLTQGYLPRTYGDEIEVYIEGNFDRIKSDYVVPPPPPPPGKISSFQWEQIKEAIEELKSLKVDARKKMDELQQIYQDMPSAGKPNPTNYKSDYRHSTTPYSANPIRTAISSNH
jgi:hypothetical protein